MKAVVALFVVAMAVFVACNDQTVDPVPSMSDAGPGSTAPATNCSSRCAAISASCGSDPTACTSLCANITEGQLTCIEDSECSGGSCTSDAGVVADASGDGGLSGDCTPLSNACRGSGECCSGAACTNKVGTSNMVCCANAGTTCAADDDCCTTHCGIAGKCCYGATVPCTTATAATCCSGICGSNGLCN